ncbi:MAG: DEAD/DEAH box helicase [Planctomycetaceae bacterium]|nr:DEAD/DEAH box helicase [Planctomycetaceae bacterium]
MQEEAAVKEEVAVQEEAASGFRAMPLHDSVQRAIDVSGYTIPTPVQAQIIPYMLEERDVLAQSQTGTGKTAAFALPILSRLNPKQRKPQVLVLAPTRELAIQVSDSFNKYGMFLESLNIATIYGGQSYDPQLRQLRRGVQVVVGTPGRVIDHIKRGTLDISQLKCLVLDEADEMLNMGFLEDVQFVLKQTPQDRQIALFSATLPEQIRAIAQDYLNDPAKITVKKKTMTADSIHQRALFVAPRDKVYALCRILEAEETDGIIVFTKTKAATLQVSEHLQRAGLSATALNGDMPQNARERTIEQFKSGRLNVLVATDVAARGLDVSRVSHVFNFDLPHDTESYIHRVGRTGRAGRRGEAIIFLSNAQRGKLRTIERVTKQKIDIVQLPTTDDINQLRIKRFMQTITDTAASQDLTMFKDLINLYAEESGKPMEVIAAALAHINQQGRPFLAKDRPQRSSREDRKKNRSDREHRDGSGDRGESGGRRRKEMKRKPRQVGPPEAGMERYRIEVGKRDGVRPGNIVGAVANEAGIDGDFIGPIQIHDFHSTVDLPEGMPRGVYQTLKKTRVAGKQMHIARDGERSEEGSDAGDKRHRKPRAGKPRHNRSTESGFPNKKKNKTKQGGKRKKRKTPTS